MRRRRNSVAAARFWKNLVPRKDPKISVFWDKWVDFDSDDNVTEPDTDEDAPTTVVPEPEPPLKPSGARGWDCEVNIESERKCLQ